MGDTVKTTLYLTETPVPSGRLLEALTRRRFYQSCGAVEKTTQLGSRALLFMKMAPAPEL